MASFTSHRRYYLSKRISSRLSGEDAMSSLWHSKQLGEDGGIELPTGFPERAALIAAGYIATEDLVGADEPELVEWVCVSDAQAKAILAAAAAL